MVIPLTKEIICFIKHFSTLVYFGILWYTLVYAGIRWYTLVYVGIRMVYDWYTAGIRLVYAFMLVYRWYTVGIRLVYDWYTIGIRVVYGWYTLVYATCHILIIYQRLPTKVYQSKRTYTNQMFPSNVFISFEIFVYF